MIPIYQISNNDLFTKTILTCDDTHYFNPTKTTFCYCELSIKKKNIYINVFDNLAITTIVIHSNIMLICILKLFLDTKLEDIMVINFVIYIYIL